MKKRRGRNGVDDSCGDYDADEKEVEQEEEEMKQENEEKEEEQIRRTGDVQ